MSAISVSPQVAVNRSATQLGQQVAADSNNVSREPTLLNASSAAASGNTAAVTADNSGSESVRVSSSIGRAASAGQLSRQEALDIYRQIASLL
ncbi:hypothetical protein HRH59_17270 [Rheinheimera sp. YQF-2]|uniref:Uncharacterized protein n=1 Tax=Rheinheimera lutimaris TaxID=2740584 RepID=A0A7Y5ATI4_9GAMM|nr:hypothetical protein [Rheinheimera lutimaris]NRQ44290.1 hypothetical protein [Rheinheimera lutimaris]